MMRESSSSGPLADRIVEPDVYRPQGDGHAGQAGVERPEAFSFNLCRDIPGTAQCGLGVTVVTEMVMCLQHDARATVIEGRIAVRIVGS